MDTSDIIRNHLKTLTDEDIANSVYLFGRDFDTEPIDGILQALSSLTDEVATLNAMISRDFEPIGDVKMPKDAKTQEIIIRDYNCKKDALMKALSNEAVYNALKSYREMQSEKGNVK